MEKFCIVTPSGNTRVPLAGAKSLSAFASDTSQYTSTRPTVPRVRDTVKVATLLGSSGVTLSGRINWGGGCVELGWRWETSHATAKAMGESPRSPYFPWVFTVKQLSDGLLIIPSIITFHQMKSRQAVV